MKKEKKTISEYWNDIFKDYKILDAINEKGSYTISSDTIKKYKEPRLMAKFDYSKQLPQIFKENNLGILPITNGEYIIGKYNLFENIPNIKCENAPIKKMSLPSFIETIDPDNIYSESNALQVAFLSGMIKNALGEEVVETIQGKMRANGFYFEIEGADGKHTIEIKKPAMEIDGGYEGVSKIGLIEAKNTLPENFIIRQLYFPYRHWHEKVNKPIIPIFFAYENGIYNFFIYEISNLYNYNSLKLQDIKRYVLTNEDSEKRKRKLFDKIETINDTPRLNIPFPQADSFNRVIGTVELIDSGIDTAPKIAGEYGLERRQGNYYITAAKYLGLVTEGIKRGEYILTPLGFAICNLDMKTRNKYLIKEILKHKVFYLTYKYYLDNGELPEKNYIMNLITTYTVVTNDETLNRRASTVKGWINWVIGCQI